MAVSNSYRFRLRSLFGVIVFISVNLATMGVGIAECLYFGIPVGWLGFRLISQSASRLRYDLLVGSSARARVLMFIMVSLMVLVPVMGWRPANAAAWMYLVGVNAWQILLVMVGSRCATLPTFLRGIVLGLPFCAALYPIFWLILGQEDMPAFVPGAHWYYIDWRSDVRRAVISPGLEFRKNGPNHSLLKKYVVVGNEDWVVKSAMGRAHLLGGGDRVNTRSALLRPGLTRILDMLPSDDARSTVMAALADRKNFARVHQGLLLTWVAYSGFPSGATTESWWRDHKELLTPTHDAQNAARRVLNWRHRIALSRDEFVGSLNEQAQYEVDLQLRAAAFQEKGINGGDEAFASAWYAVWSKN